MHHKATPILKGLALFIGTLLTLFAAYLLGWRAWTCGEITRLNALAPPSDPNTYITRRIAFDELCGLGDYAASTFLLFGGLSISMYSWHTLRNPSKAVPG